ncbi:serine/threonine-protein kinase [Occallatibacter riparius]|uniref:non-specific serine/threonine protein kinase n=1 Tax=Occallatibacter riparius TaxID=1002689 RepID=A0A9J7BN67_9BACT|nr:serine/threonine-protein kinase [Occallatibacter riparius]UWZ84332.1 protein kinase [Occallatibacter riparius]
MDRKRIARYEIVGELGRGAMGAVYRAHDPVMGRTVALKCIHAAALSSDQTNEYRQRFFREARAAGALAHPGIVPVFDAGEDDGVPFLVMELVQGQTLADSLKQGTRYSIDQVCEIGQHIAEALGYAHRNGIVHRDIKPANILMTAREVYGSERPRITDFGVAKLAGGEVTTTGQLLGTPAFMPPEQFTGAPIDGRTDLFSLGVILYRMACGEQPFAGETLTVVSYKIVHTDPIPPARLNPAIGPAVEAVMLKCLAKNPAERFQSGEELAAALAAVRFTGQTAAPASYPAQVTVVGYRSDATVDVAQTPPRGSFVSNPTPQPPYSAPPIPPAGYPKAPQPASQAYPQAAGAGPSYPPVQYPAGQPLGTPRMPQAVAPPAAPLPAPPRTAASIGSTPPPVGRTPTEAPGNGSAPPMSSSVPPRATTGAPLAASAPAKATVYTTSIAAPVIKTTSGIKIGKDEEAPKKRGFSILVWVVIAIGAIFAMRYMLQDKVQQSMEEAATGRVQSHSATPSSGPTLGASTATTEYNPHGLDPSRSGHLRLELIGIPSSVTTSLDVDGRPYWSGTPSSQSNYTGFVIPTGRHQLRITATAGAGIVASNSVSADLTPGKRVVLSTDVRPLPVPGAGALDRSARISLSERSDAMF